MVVDWQVSKSERVCAASGRTLEIGEIYYSALREEDEMFVRSDFSESAWTDVDKAPFFSYWRTRIPPAEEKKKRLVIDVEAFYTFFASLDNPTESHKQVFRYLVALILTRKRVLRLDEIEKTPEEEHLLLYDRRAEKEVRVFCPSVTDEELAHAQENLNQIFECQIGDFDEEPD